MTTNNDNEAFDAKLAEIIDRKPASHLLTVPGIAEVLLEHFNNDVLQELEAADLDVELVVVDDVEARFERLAAAGFVSLQVEHDPHHSFEDYEGDVYNPEVNTDIDPAKLAEERTRDRETYYREGGAFGLRGAISLAGGWHYVDGVWGIYPRSHAEAKDNPYRAGIMRQTLAELDRMLTEVSRA